MPKKQLNKLVPAPTADNLNRACEVYTRWVLLSRLLCFSRNEVLRLLLLL
jgi:hypothetical protein